MKATTLLRFCFSFLMFLCTAMCPLVAVYLYRNGPEWLQPIERTTQLYRDGRVVEIVNLTDPIPLVLSTILVMVVLGAWGAVMAVYSEESS